MVKSVSRREFLCARVLFFLAPFVTLLAPLTTVPVLIVLSIGCVRIAFLQGQRLRDLLQFDLGLALFAAVTAYLFLNATWSLDPSRAFSKAAWFGVVVIMTFVTCRALSTWQGRQVRLAFTTFLAGLAIGTAFILFELVTDQFLVRLLFNTFPITRPDSTRDLIIQDGEVVKIAAFELNRNVAVMLLLLWPALLGLTKLTDKRWRVLCMTAFSLAAFVAIWLSRHETSQIGLGLSAIAFLAALLWPTVARRAAWLGWCLAFLLVVPLATFAHKAELHEVDWLPYSARDRVVLWAYTAEQIPKAPLLGIGIASTRKIQMDQPKVEKPKGDDFAWRAGWHSHNQYLQAWYELGAVGVILILVAGTAVFGCVSRLSGSEQPFILAQLTAFIVIAAFAWGMWQSWLMALPGLAAVYATFAVRLCTAEESAPAHPRARLDDAA